MISLAVAVFCLMPTASQAAFSPALDGNDEAVLQYLLTALPGEVLSKDPSRIQALEARVAEFALSERARQKADLEFAVGKTFWDSAAVEPRWMVESSVAMIAGLEQAGRGTGETAEFTAALSRKSALLAQMDTLDSHDDANLPRFVQALQSLLKDDGHKLSEIYLRLRALYVPLHLAPALAEIPFSHRLLPGLNSAAWDAVMLAVEKRAADTAAVLPVSVRASFAKSVADIFFAYKFPLLDLGYSQILDPLHPNPSLRPDSGASEALSSLRSLERVLQLSDVFSAIDRAGGGRAYLRSIQPQALVGGELCQRLPALAGFTEDDWKKIRASKKVIVLDPGHLGGEFADDSRDVSPPNEQGKESYGYREGHDTFVIANLARVLLTECAGLDKANVLLTRRGLHDEGGYYFNKAGFVIDGQPSLSNKTSDNLYFRKAVIAFARPDFVISMHTDYSDTFTQHGLVIVPRHPSGLESGFYKSRAQYDLSLSLAEGLQAALKETMYSGKGTPTGKSAQDFLGFEFKSYYLKEMDLQIFRDFLSTPVALVEGYDYASPEVRALMNGVARGHLASDPDVRSFRIAGDRYFYHTVHRSYAEGVALAALRFLLLPTR